MEDKRFDDIIQSKLSEFKMDATPDWELFQAKRFDDLVSSKLADHSMAAATPRWDLFQEKQEQIQLKRQDRAFDNTVRQNIGNYTVPYNSDHWIQLKERLEKVYSRRQGLYTLKSLEILVLLILLINFAGNFNNILGISPELNAISNPIVDVQMESTKHSDTKTNLIAEGITETTNRGDQLNGVTTTQKETTSTQNAVSVNDGGNNNIVVDKSYLNNDIPVVVSQIASGGSNYNTNPSRVSSESNTLVSNSVIPNTGVNEKNDSSTSDRNGLELNALLGLSNRDIGFLDWSIDQPVLSLNDKLELTLNDKVEEPILTPNSGWLHGAISFDNNTTVTPFNPEFPSGRKEGSISKESVGFSASALYSRTFNKLEIETGLSYSRYSRDSDFFDVYFDGLYAFQYRLNSIKYELVSTPIRTKFHFLQRTDFTMFASAGVSPEVIVASKYEDVNGFAGLPPTMGPLLDPESVTSNFEKNANFTNGVLHESPFSDSFFMRGSVGAGIQKNISSNVSAYISGDYYFNLINTVGPTNDEISKFSLNFGIKRKI